MVELYISSSFKRERDPTRPSEMLVSYHITIHKTITPKFYVTSVLLCNITYIYVLRTCCY